MTLGEAAQILGISTEAPAEEVLRAYFRLVRFQEAAQNPEGLRRVREALGVFSSEADSPAPPSTDLQPEEIDHAAGSGDPYLMLTAAQALAQSGQSDSACELALRSLQAIRDANTPAALPSPMLPALRVFFLLQADGQLQTANDLLQQMQGLAEHAWLSDGSASSWWVLAHEMSQLPARFPRHLRSQMAHSILTDDRDIAVDAMHELAMSDPDSAEEAARLLQPAPTLFSSYGHLLSGPKSSFYAQPLFQVPAAITVIFAFLHLFHLARLFPDSDVRPPPPHITFTRPFTLYSDQYYEAAEAIKTSCDYDPEIYRSEVCYAGINLLRTDGRCSSIIGAQNELLKKIAEHPPDNPYTLSPEAIDAVQDLVDAVCLPIGEELPPAEETP